MPQRRLDADRATRDSARVTGYLTLTFACANCDQVDMANPNLVMSIPARWNAAKCQYVPDPNGQREPICETCAHQLLERFKAEHKPIPAVVQEPDYFERAYGFPAAEESEVLG